MYIIQRSNIKKKTIINNRCPLLSSAVANSAVSPHQRRTRDVVSASLFYFFLIILTIFYNYIFIINSFNSFNNNDGGLKYLSNTRYRFVCRSIKQYDDRSEYQLLINFGWLALPDLRYRFIITWLVSKNGLSNFLFFTF